MSRFFIKCTQEPNRPFINSPDRMHKFLVGNSSFCPVSGTIVPFMKWILEMSVSLTDFNGYFKGICSCHGSLGNLSPCPSALVNTFRRTSYKMLQVDKWSVSFVFRVGPSPNAPTYGIEMNISHFWYMLQVTCPTYKIVYCLRTCLWNTIPANKFHCSQPLLTKPWLKIQCFAPEVISRWKTCLQAHNPSRI